MREVLVVFDLDQTLVKVLPVHFKAFHDMFLSVFNVPGELTDIKYDGLTVPVIINKVCQVHKVKPVVIKKFLGKAIRHYEKKFVSALRSRRCSYSLPGAKSLLRFLHKNNFTLCVLTGDTKSVANVILKHEGFDKYFKTVVTSDGQTRNKMAKDLVSGIKKQRKIKVVVFVGDSIHDLKAGKSVRAKTIVVTTGSYSRKELAKLKPDLLVSSLKDKEVKKNFEVIK